MAKKPIPSLLIPVLGILSVTAALLLQFWQGDIRLPRIPLSGDSTNEAKSPAATTSPVKPPEPTVELTAEERLAAEWQGIPVPEILSSLTADPPDPVEAISESVALPSPLLFPRPDDFDLYLPRFEVKIASAGAAPPPPFSSFLVIDGTPLFSHPERSLSLTSKFSTMGGRHLLPADFDGDGDLDLFITRGAGMPSSLLRRNSEGDFEDITTASGLLDFSRVCEGSWVDFDLDGRLDLCLVVASETSGGPSRIRLYHNRDKRQFERLPDNTAPPLEGICRGLRCHDLDGDAFPDLLLSLGGETPRLVGLVAIPTLPSRQWSFGDASAVLGLEAFEGGGPLACGDLDIDGRPELITSSGSGRVLILSQEDPASNVGRPAPFIDLGEMFEIEGVSAPSAILCEDLDGDGFLDLAITGGEAGHPAARAWWNVGGLHLKPIPGAAGLAGPGRIETIVRSDPDGDGIASLFVSTDSASAELVPLPETFRDHALAVIEIPPNEIGATLTIDLLDDRRTLSRLVREIDEMTESIGLGGARSIQSLQVTWNGENRATTAPESLPINHRLRFTASTGVPTEITPLAPPLSTAASLEAVPPDTKTEPETRDTSPSDRHETLP